MNMGAKRLHFSLDRAWNQEEVKVFQRCWQSLAAKSIMLKSSVGKAYPIAKWCFTIFVITRLAIAMTKSLTSLAGFKS